MSHLRNLFHKPFEPVGQEAPRPQPSAVALAEEVTAPPVAARAALPEFPVEEARIGPASRLIYYIDSRSPAADKIRYVRMRLRDHWAAGKLKRLLITSPLAGDGKSTILANLATALTERGKRSVLVIEGDLHHSTLSTNLKLRPWAGLTDCLQDDSLSPLSHIRRIEPLGWHLLPAGEPRRNPTELIQTPAIGVILQKVSACFDWVLIDSPPVIPLTDSIALQQHVDASLLVVRAGRTPQEAIEQSISLLGHKNIVGVILNGIERRYQPYYQKRYYDGDSRPNED